MKYLVESGFRKIVKMAIPDSDDKLQMIVLCLGLFGMTEMTILLKVT